MAGKTHSRYVTVTVDGNDITASVTSINGVGVTNSEVDFSTLASALNEIVPGRGDANLSISGPFNTATNQAHDTLEPLAGDPAGADVVIAIGDGAAPTAGDPKWTLSPGVVLSYVLNIGDNAAVTYNCTIRAGESATATWGTI